MQFTNPYILYGLLAIGIPIAIHLFNLRRFKKLEFTNVAFIREIKSQTRKSSRLKHLILLLLRILAIIALVFAFARPFIPAEENSATGKQQEVSIYIDNSFSMEGESTAGPLLELAKKRALDIVEAFGPQADFQIISNERPYSGENYTDKEQAINEIGEISIHPQSILINKLIEQYGGLKSKNNASRTLFLISDFQKNNIQLQEYPGFDSTAQIYFVYLPHATQNNLLIDSCYLSSPYVRAGEMLEIRAVLRNESPDYLEKIPVKLILNGQQRAFASTELAPNSETTVLLTFRPQQSGNLSGYIEISDYPIRFDDRYYLNIAIRPEINILSIYSGDKKATLGRLFGVDSLFHFRDTELKTLRYDEISAQDLLILQNLNEIPSGLAMELNKFLEAGGSLAVIPSAETYISNYNQFLASYGLMIAAVDTVSGRADFIQSKSPFFNGVFERLPKNIKLPDYKQHFPISFAMGSINESLMNAQNGDILLARHNSENGNILLFASPLEQPFSKWDAHALLLPVMFKAAFLSSGMQNIAFTPANGQSMRLKSTLLNEDKAPEIISPDQRNRFIPLFRRNGQELEIGFNPEINYEAGIHQLLNGSQSVPLAVNYSRRESSSDFFTEKESAELANSAGFKVITNTLNDRQIGQNIINSLQGKQLWRWFIIFALIFLGIEILILRFWK